MALKHLGIRGKNFSRYVTWVTEDGTPQPVYPCSPLGSSIMPVLNSAVYLGGKNDGRTIEDLTFDSNAVGRLSFGTIKVRQGHVRVEVNPILYETAVVQGPTLIDEKNSQEVFLVVRANKKTCIDLPWLIKLYIED